jgi:hypothetical protein
MAQTASNRPSGYSILNGGCSLPGGPVGYGVDRYGTEALEESTAHAEPISKQTGAVDKAPRSQKSSGPRN